MTRHRLRIAVGVVLSVAIAIGIVLVVSGRTSDCATVQSMIAYNNDFNEHVESSAPNGPQIRIAEYREWASHLDQLAEKIRDPALAEDARNVTNLAEESLPLVEEYLKDGPLDPQYNSAPPQYIKDYGRIAQQFKAAMVTLDQKCRA